MSTEGKWLAGAFAFLLLGGGGLALRSAHKRQAALAAAEAQARAETEAEARASAPLSVDEIRKAMREAPPIAAVPSAPGRAAPAAQPPMDRAGVPAQWLSGARGYASALEAQKNSGAPLLVYFYVDWCKYCRNLDQNGWPDAAVQGELAHLVKVKLNPEDGSAEQALADSFGANRFPSVFVIAAGTSQRSKLRIPAENTAKHLLGQLQRARAN